MKSKSKAVILIVDDQPMNIFALEHMLEGNDRILLKANNGQEALQLSLNRAIDLIILDVQMPGMDGFEVAQILKSNNRTRDIPIIFATAVSKEREFVMKGYEEGAIDYLYKPLDAQIVKAKVAILLKLQIQKKELVEKNRALQKTGLLINNSADIIGVANGKNLKIQEVNKAFTTLLGYSFEEVKDTSLYYFFSDEGRKKLDRLIMDGV